MYKKLEPLSVDTQRKLLELQASVIMKTSNSHRRRIGVNGINNLSIYKYSRFLTWTAAQRDTFSSVFPKNADIKAVVKWFVHYPAGEGFLDRIETWKDDRSPCWITAYNLNGAGNIELNGEEIIVPERHGITFPLTMAHEIKKTTTGTLWACVMTFDNVW